MSEDSRIHFIVGYPRSGTTLLAAMLSKAKGVVVTPETNYFRGARVEAKRKNARGRKALSILKSDKRMSDIGVNFELITVDDNDDFDDLYKKILKLFGKQNQGVVIIEKTPLHALYLKQLRQVFPDAKILHLVRDGRDVIASNIKEEWTFSSIYKHAAEWRELVCQNAFQENGSIMNVQYEDLILHPKNVVRDIFEFLEIDASYADLKYAPSSAVVPKWEREWKAKALEEIDRENIFKWKKSPMTLENIRVAHIMKAGLERYGYDFKPLDNDIKGHFFQLFYSPPCYRFLIFIARLKRRLLIGNYE